MKIGAVVRMAWGFGCALAFMPLVTSGAVTATATFNKEKGAVAVSVSGPASEVRGSVALYAGKAKMGSVTVKKDGDQAKGSTEIGMPPLAGLAENKTLAVKVAGKEVGSVALPTGEIEEFYAGYPSAFMAKYLRFKPYVFTSAQFPQPQLTAPAGETMSPAKLLGSHKIVTTYYDSELNEVKSADKTGRYAAVVRIEAAGKTLQAVVPLCRASGDDLSKLPEEAVAAAKKGGSESGVLMAGAYAAMNGESGDPKDITGKWTAALAEKLGIKGVKAAPTRAARYQYAVSVPKDYDSDKKKLWPMILHMHGGGYNGSPEKLISMFNPQARDKEFIIVALKQPTTAWWDGGACCNIARIVMDQYRVDRDRVFATGHSLGGFCVSGMPLADPTLWAGLVSMSGIRLFDAAVQNMKANNIAYWLFIGELDSPNLDDMDKSWMGVVAGGIHGRYTRLPGWGHSTEWYALPRREIFDWMLTLNRKTNGEPAGSSGKKEAKKETKKEETASKAPKLGKGKEEKGAAAGADPASVYRTALKAFDKKDWSRITQWCDANRGNRAVRDGERWFMELDGNDKYVPFWPWYETDAATAHTEKHGIGPEKYMK